MSSVRTLLLAGRAVCSARASCRELMDEETVVLVYEERSDEPCVALGLGGWLSTLDVKSSL